MDVSDAQISVIEGIQGRFNVIGFDAPDSLSVAEVRPDGNALLQDVEGNMFLLSVQAL